MRTLYENLHILHVQKRIVSTEAVCGNTVYGKMTKFLVKTLCIKIGTHFQEKNVVKNADKSD